MWLYLLDRFRPWAVSNCKRLLRLFDILLPPLSRIRLLLHNLRRMLASLFIRLPNNSIRRHLLQRTMINHRVLILRRISILLYRSDRCSRYFIGCLAIIMLCLVWVRRLLSVDGSGDRWLCECLLGCAALVSALGDDVLYLWVVMVGWVVVEMDCVFLIWVGVLCILLAVSAPFVTEKEISLRLRCSSWSWSWLDWLGLLRYILWALLLVFLLDIGASLFSNVFLSCLVHFDLHFWASFLWIGILESSTLALTWLWFWMRTFWCLFEWKRRFLWFWRRWNGFSSSSNFGRYRLGIYRLFRWL